MTQLEMTNAWIIVGLAIKDMIISRDSEFDVIGRAIEYGKHVTNRKHIEEIMSAIDIGSLKFLVDRLK